MVLTPYYTTPTQRDVTEVAGAGGAPGPVRNPSRQVTFDTLSKLFSILVRSGAQLPIRFRVGVIQQRDKAIAIAPA